MCGDIYKQGSFQEAPLPSPNTTHVHCFINITFQGSVWKSTHLTSTCLLFLSSQIIWYLVADLSSSPSPPPPFFFTNLLVVDLSSSSSYLDRIKANWGCFSQFLDQLWGIYVDFGWFRSKLAPNRIESATKKIKIKKWWIGASNANWRVKMSQVQVWRP